MIHARVGARHTAPRRPRSPAQSPERVADTGSSRVAALAILLAASLPICAAVPASAQQTRALVVAGLGGTDAYRREFHELAHRLDSALVHKLGVPAENVTVLEEAPTPDPNRDQGKARSTKENVLSALATMAGAAGPDDDILVVLIGHGTSEGEDVRFNLPGPDLTPADLAKALAAFKTQKVAVVNTASASGGFVAPLAAPNRVVVAATATARERNATVFPTYFVAALAGSDADFDKDGRVSILEAFRYAREEVARHYKEANELLVEHAVLDDNGDGKGSRAPAADSADGKLAATFRLGPSGGTAATAAPATRDPVLTRLYAERKAIQKEIDDLRARKTSLPPDQYQEQLENLLVQLGLKDREIRQHGGGS